MCEEKRELHGTTDKGSNAVLLSPPLASLCISPVCMCVWCVVETTHTHTHTPHREKKKLEDAECYQRGLCILKSGHLVLGLASGLEAFSREPPCDGFGALAVRQTPETRGTAWEFLSYYPILPSRYLRDPFTISHTKKVVAHIYMHIRVYAHIHIRVSFSFGDERTKYYPPLARPKNDPTSVLHG